MGTQVSVTFGRVSVCKLGTGKNSRHWYPSLKTLLPQSHTLELRQIVAFSSAVDSCILEYKDTLAGSRVRGMWLQHRRAHGCLASHRACRVGHPHSAVLSILTLETPDVAAGIELKLGSVVAFVEVFENG